jgi:hypothetical protein
VGVSNKWLRQIADSFVAETIKVLLVIPSYSYDPDNQFVSDIVPASNEAAGGTYVRKTVSGLLAVENDTDDRGEIYFDNVVWTALSVTDDAVSGAWFYKFVTTDADSPLRFFLPFSKTTNGEDFTLRPPTAGAIWIVGG